MNTLVDRSNMTSGEINEVFAENSYITRHSFLQYPELLSVVMLKADSGRQAQDERQLNELKHLSVNSGMSAYLKKHHDIFKKSTA